MSFLEAVFSRDRILSAMSQNHSAYLAALRAFGKVIAMKNGSVTVDEVREYAKAQGFPLPAELNCDERILGSLFSKSKEFEPVGFRPTTRLEFAARVGKSRSQVTVYQLRKEIA